MKRRKSVCNSKRHNEIIERLKKMTHSIKSIVADEKENSSTNFDSAVSVMKLVNERVRDAVDTGMRIYHKQEKNGEYYSDQEKLAFLLILKKIQDPKEWYARRVISSKQQLQCIFGTKIVTKEERRDSLILIEDWHDYKVQLFPAVWRKVSCDKVAIHYGKRLTLGGVESNALNDKIKHLSTAAAPDLNDSLSSDNSKKSTRSSTASSVPSIIENCCRLCGDTTSELVINLNRKSRNNSYKEIIEYFCRCEISVDERLPQFVCIKCKSTLDNFSLFSRKVMTYQLELNDKLHSPSTMTAIKLEEEEYNEDSITINDCEPQIPLDAFMHSFDSSFHDDDDAADLSKQFSVDNGTVLRKKNKSMQREKDDSMQEERDESMLKESTKKVANNLVHPDKTPQKPPIKLGQVKTEMRIRPSYVKLERLPIIYCPSDTDEDDSDDSDDDDDEDVFPIDFVPESSSPIITPKFYVKTEPLEETIRMNIEDEDDNSETQFH